jgi:5'-nucleotidase
MSEYQIILTNDDGITSKGLLALLNEVAEIADVLVVAPEQKRTALGKSLTMDELIRVREVTLNGHKGLYTISGTPADAVSFGMFKMQPKDPNLVISGINDILNIGLMSIYTSGTVGACFHAALCGIPSLAFAIQLDESTEEDLHKAAEISKQIIVKILNEGMPEGVDVLNINFPSKLNNSTPIKVTKPIEFVFRGYVFEKLSGDSSSEVYRWSIPSLSSVEPEKISETDFYAVKTEKAISITPLSLGNINVNSPSIIKKILKLKD